MDRCLHIEAGFVILSDLQVKGYLKNSFPLMKRGRENVALTRKSGQRTLQSGSLSPTTHHPNPPSHPGPVISKSLLQFDVH